MAPGRTAVDDSSSRPLVLEVRAIWGATTLRVWHLSPPRAFYVGEDPATCDFVVTAELAGARRKTLYEPPAPAPGASAQARVGALTFEFTIAAAPGRWPALRSLSDRRLASLVAGVAVVYALMLVISVLTLRRQQPEDDELTRDQMYLMQTYLRAGEEAAMEAHERVVATEVSRVAALSPEQQQRMARQCEQECLRKPPSVTGTGKFVDWLDQCAEPRQRPCVTLRAPRRS